MAGETRKDHDSCGGSASRDNERRIRDLASQQDGLVHRDQLLGELSRRQIDYRIASGRLIEVHRGVGHSSLTRHARLRAAAMVGGDVALSHSSAGEWQEVLGLRSGLIHITCPRRIVRPRLIAHTRSLPDDELEEVDGALVTTVARTLLDLAATEGRQPFESALRKAEFLRRGSPVSLPALLDRYPGARGCRLARRVLAEKLYLAPTESWLEDVFLPFLSERRIEMPRSIVEIETPLGTFRVDCLWPGQGLIVELDGGAAHDGEMATVSDRDRDGELLALGFRVLRIAYALFVRNPDIVERRLRSALARPAGWAAA